jgi:hypothetical protein
MTCFGSVVPALKSSTVRARSSPTRAYACIHTYIHTYMHTYVYIHTCTYICTHTYTNTYYLDIHTYIYICIYSYVYIYLRVGGGGGRGMCVCGIYIYPPTDGKGLMGILPRLDDFYFTTAERKFWKIAGALFRISSMTNPLVFTPKCLIPPLQFST